jgi:hypothetical protein
VAQVDPENLLLRLSSGKPLKESEVLEVLDFLKAVDVSLPAKELALDEIYSFLLVLGRSKFTQHRSIVERFLDLQESENVSLALTILCKDWELAEEYLEQLISFALGHSWDVDDDARTTSIEIIGEYLNKSLKESEAKSAARQKAANILGLVLSLFDDGELKHSTRQHAYFALCRAGGKEWEEIPSAYRKLDLETEIDKGLVSSLRQLASESSSKSSGKSAGVVRSGIR